MNNKIQEEKRKDVDTANQQAGVVDQHLQLLAKERAGLKAAKESMDPTLIRQATLRLDNVRIRLMLTRDWLRRGIAQAPENVAELQAAADRASEQLEPIMAEVAHAQEQAERLAEASGGSLAELARDKTPASPEETRKLASEVAPIGLCDDPAMQSPTSHACPLSSEQRDATRDVVTEEISAIADRWREAASDQQLAVRLEPLFRKSGINTLVNLLLSVATGWLTSQVGKLFLTSVNGARNALARKHDPELTAITGVPGPFGGAPPLGKPAGDLVSGFGSKLAERVLGVFKTTGPTDTPQILFDQMKEAATAWRKQARLDTRQLPDPVLAGLANGLSDHPFNAQYFRSQIDRLLERFHHVDKIGEVTMKHTQPLQPIWVVSPTGGLRLALARRHTVMAPVTANWTTHEPGDTERERESGQWIFDSWVDRALYSVALAHDASPPTLPMHHMAWRNPPANAFAPGDVRVGPDRKESTTP
ncbi:MAG: hypothetical protein H0T46_11245 [Deltaproteobacteria bacterium]|nr:hypothetical protein [Deltaproteobacteria bacterium]